VCLWRLWSCPLTTRKDEDIVEFFEKKRKEVSWGVGLATS
jgi:hypothetical protein